MLTHSDHQYKVDIPTTILLLQELHFHSIKKLSKENYQAIFELGIVKTSYYIKFYFSSQLTTEKLKTHYTDWIIHSSNMKNKNTKFLIITLDKLSHTVESLAKELNIDLLNFNMICQSLVNTQVIEQKLKDYEKEIEAQHIQPILFKTMTLQFSNFISSLVAKDKKEIAILETEQGGGKTTFLKHVRLYLLNDFFNQEYSRIGCLPIVLDATQYPKYPSFMEFVLKEGFLKQGIDVVSQKALLILMQLNRFVFLVDNLDHLYKESPIFVLNLMDQMVSQNRDYKYHFLWVVNKEFFYLYHHQRSKHIKHFFKPYFAKGRFSFYELTQFSLLDIKNQLQDKRLKALIEKSPYLRYIANFPYLINLLTKIPIEQLQLFNTDEDLFQYLLESWKSEYLTDMGKDLVLETMALEIVKKGTFELKDIPDYIENFIHIEFKDSGLNMTRLKKDLSLTKLIKETKPDQYEFCNPYYAFYFISKRVKEEIQKDYYEHLYYLSYPIVFQFLKNQFSYDQLLTIFSQYISKSKDNYEKGKRFIVYIKVLKQMLPEQKILEVKGIDLSYTRIEFESLSRLKLTSQDHIGVELYKCDISYSEGSKMKLESSDISYSSYISSKLEEVEWNHVLSKQTLWNKSLFYKVYFNDVQFFQSFLNNVHFKDSRLEYSSLHGVVASESQFFHTQISYTDLSNFDGYRAEFIKSHLKECRGVSVSLAESTFDASSISDIDFIISTFEKAEFRSSQLTNIQFDACNLFNVNFQNSELTNISFKMADLRKTSFEGAKLTNVIFDDADMRGSNILETNVILCPVSQESLKKALI